mmetsp:Transcript_34422/g.53812  ORF Transcript_34422/g.53812 Transcript_34422/m.53812 type:complete len:399 (-) Transcript_34422:134-1330(-)
MTTQKVGNAHFDGTTPRDDRTRLNRPLDDHEGIVDATFTLGDELLGTSTQNDGTSQRGGAFHKDVKAFVSHLTFFEFTTRSQDRFRQSVGSGLHGGVGRLGDTFQVPIRDASGAKETSIGKVLRGEISNGQFGQDDVGAAFHAGVQFSVNDLPFGVDDGLIFGGARNSDLGVFLFRFEFQFDIQQEDLWVFELFCHLFETCVRKGLFKGNAFYQKGGSHVTSRNLFDGDPFHNFVDIACGVQLGDGADYHGCEQILMTRDELRIEGGARTLEQHFLLIRFDGQTGNLFDGHLTRLAGRLNHSGGADAFFHKWLEFGQQLGGQQDDRSRTVSDGHVLAHGNVHQRFGGRVGDFQKPHNRGTIVTNRCPRTRGHQFVHSSWPQRRSNGVRDGLAGIDIAD